MRLAPQLPVLLHRIAMKVVQMSQVQIQQQEQLQQQQQVQHQQQLLSAKLMLQQDAQSQKENSSQADLRNSFEDLAARSNSMSDAAATAANPLKRAASISRPAAAATNSRKCLRPSQDAFSTSGSVVLPPGVKDIDAGERGDAQHCSEYQHQQMAWLRARETSDFFQIGMRLAAKQNPRVIGFGERALLVNWLCGRAQDCKLASVTLHLAVSILDRSLAALRIETALEGEVLAAAALHMSGNAHSCLFH
jgi:Cyclin, N-terminal domain